MMGTLPGVSVAAGAGMPKPGMIEPLPLVRAVNSSATSFSPGSSSRAQA